MMKQFHTAWEALTVERLPETTAISHSLSVSLEPAALQDFLRSVQSDSL